MGKGECDAGCVKYLLFFFNGLFCICGLAIIAVGCWALLDKNIGDHVGEENVSVLKNGAYVIIAFGVFITILTFLGCCGAIRESQCMLFTFFLVLTIIFIALIAVGAYVLIKKGDIEKGVKDYIEDSANSESSSRQASLNKTRMDFECCAGDPCLPAEYSDKCTDVVWAEMEKSATVIGAIALGIAFILILGMIFSLCLCCSIRRSKYSV